MEDAFTNSTMTDKISFNPTSHQLDWKERIDENHDWDGNMDDHPVFNCSDLYEEMKVLNCDEVLFIKSQATDENRRILQKKKRKIGISSKRKKNRSRKYWSYRQKHHPVHVKETTEKKNYECENVLKKSLQLPQCGTPLITTYSCSKSQKFIVHHTFYKLKFLKAMMRSQISRALIIQYMNDKEDARRY